MSSSSENPVQTSLQQETATISKDKKRDISPSAYRKRCDICQTPCDVLVRCRIDDTIEWHFVCTSRCWKQVSGGEIDGPDKEFYTYGGMWKNKHAGVSAKKPKNPKASRNQEKVRPWSPREVRYFTNGKVEYKGISWICRKSHESREETAPDLGYTYWKQSDTDEARVEARHLRT